MTRQLLIVDDEPRVAQLLCRVAARIDGWQAEAVHSFHALQIAFSVDLTVLVLDLHMPDCSPDDIFSFLAQQATKPHLLLTSGSDRDTLTDFARQAQQQGLTVIGVLPKPFGINDLKQLLDHLP